MSHAAQARIRAADLAVKAQVADDLAGVSASGLAPSPRAIYSGHLAFFSVLCLLTGLGPSSFGLPVAQGGYEPD